jgi:predicted GNAT family acetyltransferase
MTDTVLADNPSAHQFELKAGGAVAAHADYELLPGAVKFTHTEVLPSHEGKGFGSKLARFALDEVRGRGLNVEPACEFIAGYIRKHPEYLDLVTEDMRRTYKL